MMTFNLRCRIQIMCVAALFWVAQSHAEEIQCPDISTKQALAHPVDGWTEEANDFAAHRLKNVMFFDGDPKERASLVPSEDTRSKATWRFGANQETKVWMACVYAETDVFVARPLPKSISQCTVTYNPKIMVEALPQVEHITCK